MYPILTSNTNLFVLDKILQKIFHYKYINLKLANMYRFMHTQHYSYIQICKSNSTTIHSLYTNGMCVGGIWIMLLWPWSHVTVTCNVIYFTLCGVYMLYSHTVKVFITNYIHACMHMVCYVSYVILMHTLLHRWKISKLLYIV